MTVLHSAMALFGSTGLFTILHFTMALLSFAVLKTDSPNFYKPPTYHLVRKTNSPNIYKPPTRFFVLKTGSPNFYKAPIFIYKPNTCLEVFETDFPTF